MTSENPSSEPKKNLDELIAQFEDVARKRPTPAELAEAERTGAVIQHEEPPEPEPAELPDAPTQPAVGSLALPDVAPVVAELPLEPAPAAPTTEPASTPERAPGAPAMLETIEQWWAAGQRIEVELPGGARHAIFVRGVGQRQWMTMIHGFTTP